MTPRKALIAAIRAGDYDDQLDQTATMIHTAVVERRKVVSIDRSKTLESGQHVRILDGNIKPRYFIGRTGTIDDLMGDTAWVKLDTVIVRGNKRMGRVGVSSIYLEPIDE
jgi:hypothetical protein